MVVIEVIDWVSVCFSATQSQRPQTYHPNAPIPNVQSPPSDYCHLVHKLLALDLKCVGVVGQSEANHQLVCFATRSVYAYTWTVQTQT